jgi:thiamine transport system substrate-binding protein
MIVRRTTPSRLRVRAAVAVAALLGLVAACGDTGDADDAGTDEPATVTLRLLTHDSFAVSDGILEAFTAETGIEVELLQGGDAGTVVNQAILTKGNPQADVLFGVDSTFLSRAVDAGVFVPHTADGLEDVPSELRFDPSGSVTPIDYGDVCVNFDKAYFADRGLPVPATFDDLVDPAYRDLLVVQNPATSSPGLAFLLATVAEYGEDGWEHWWAKASENGVLVVDGWEEAYNSSFSGGGASQGDRPLVVSYASSPPVEVLYADPPVTEAPTGVVESTCFRQIEGAGILAGTDHEDEAGQLVDFLLSETFQADVPLQMFVFPARADVELPAVFLDHAARPAEVLELGPEDIAEHREEWIDSWTDLVLR